MPITKKQELSNVPISKLIPYAKNPRKNDAAVRQVAKSLQEFGLVKNSIVVDEDMVLITGHTTTKAMQSLGWTKAPEVTQVFGLTAAQKQAYRIADNKLGELAEWDTELLGLELEELRGLDFDIELTGFDDKEFDAMIRELHKDDEPQDSEPQISRAEELRKEWGTELGQMWQCGDHRVICGDCTDPAVVKRVMQGEKADMEFTDPPYGIGKAIANDDLSEADLTEFNKKWITTTINHIKKDSHFVCFHSPRLFHTVLNNAVLQGWKFQRMMTLYKPNDCTFPWQGFILKSESILLFITGNPEYLKIDPFLHDTLVYNNGGFKEEVSHPTAKLKQMIYDLMARFGGRIVLDPFLGSGTTMIACENLGRKCRGIEIDPGYVAVILQRYKDTFPDKEIKLL